MIADGRLWAPDTAGSNSAGTVNGPTSLACALKVPVVEGDLTIVATFIDTSLAFPSEVIKDPRYGLNRDSLNNPYQSVAIANDATKGQSTRLWIGTVLYPGVPTITMQANPTPGTSVLGSAAVLFDRLVGPGKQVPWALDGAAVTAVLTNPGTGTDAISSGALASLLRSGVVVAVCQDDSNNLAISPGTGFVGGAGGATPGGLLEYAPSSGPGSPAATFTTADGTANFGVVAAILSWPLVDGDTGSPSPQQQEDRC